MAFGSHATNPIAADTDGQPDVFVKDLGSGAIERVSVDAGSTRSNGASTPLDISPDGRWVLFGYKLV